jgi:hypothetical protein
MTIYELDPIRDPRWRELLERHPNASVFHSPAWLQALNDTYRYEAIAITTTEPGRPLENGLVFCRVKSWLTGCRLVSLPFSDHCQPLVDSESDMAEFLNYLRVQFSAGRWKYVELRLLNSDVPEGGPAFKESASFCFHQLDLRPTIDDLQRKMERTSIRRPLRVAEREGLTIEWGRSDSLLQKLRDLLLLSRQRHHVPPQPLEWFQSLIRNFNEELTIWIVSAYGHPAAGLLALRFKDDIVFKNGGSDARFHSLGSVPFLYFTALRDAQKRNATSLDLGRSDLDNPGLLRFKDNWGASRVPLTYYRLSQDSAALAWRPRGMGLAQVVFSSLPKPLLTTAGRLLYRHIG